jgi:hypothetical protein
MSGSAWAGTTSRGPCFASAGLKELGLEVSFHSEKDDHIGGFEKRGYARARRLGIPVQPAVELSENPPASCSGLTAFGQLPCSYMKETYTVGGSYVEHDDKKRVLPTGHANSNRSVANP